MEQKTLTYAERETVTKSSVKTLRKNGQIPAVIYGQGKNVHISVDSWEMGTKFKTISESTLIKLENGKKAYEVLVKDFQEDVLTGSLKHIDFYEVASDKMIKTHVSIHVKGSPVGVRNGGLLEHLIHGLEIECLPKDLPSTLVVDVTNLDVGQSIHVKELSIPQGVKIHVQPEAVVVHMISTKNLNVEPVAPVAAAAEPAAGAAGAAPAAAPAAGTEKKA